MHICRKHIALLTFTTLLAACVGGTNEQDSLRDPISQTGISVGLQVNLAKGANTADAAASIYKDGARQPLVGGDFFMATTRHNGSIYADAVLKSIENLAGDYLGRVAVAGSADTVVLSTEYDPVRAREDRWYPVDELLVDPGPNTDLVGYSFEVIPPPSLQNLAINAATYTSRNDNIVLTWNAGNGDQMTSNAVVNCRSSDGTSYTFPKFNVLGDVDANGTYTLQVRDIIPNTNIINAVATLEHEVATLITAALVEYYTYGLVSVKNIPLSTFRVQSCDVQLTVFREMDYRANRPAGVTGGFVIGSTSDTVSFRFVPPVI